MGTPRGMPPEFSICVATHNRAALLPDLFAHLGTLRNVPFELVIVDDGSQDETPETLAELARGAAFPVSHAHIENLGRGQALNKAFDLATGRFIFILDDDDRIAPEALSDILSVWDSIPKAERKRFCGVCGLAARSSGNVIGMRFSADSEDSDFFTMRILRGVRGDKREVFLRSCLGDWRFPHIEGETRVSTNLLWFYLAARYRARFVNRVWLIKDYRADGLTAKGLQKKVRSSGLTALYYGTTLKLFPRMPLNTRMRFTLSYMRFASHHRVPLRRRLADAGNTPLALAVMPLGAVAGIADRLILALRRTRNAA